MSVFALLGLVMAGFCLFALCGNLIYWYETLNTPEPRIPSPEPGVASCLREYVITLGSYFLNIGLFPIGLFLRRGIAASAAAPGRGHTRPVVLIHGLNNNAAVWLYFTRRLEREGYDVSTYAYHSLFIPFSIVIKGLDNHVRQVEAVCGQIKPILICHSLGGLLARHWLGLDNNRSRVQGLVTLGTPHRGSKLAVLAPGALARNIRPGAELIRELADAPSLGIPCTALASPTDEAVLPASGLVPPDGWKLRLTGRIGHFSMLFWPPVADMVAEELRAMEHPGG